MKIRILRSRPATLIAFVGLLPFFRPVPACGIENNSPQLAQLLNDAEEEALELAFDATETEDLIQSEENWVSHALVLAAMKGHVDNLALIVQKLRKEQSSGSALQAQAVQQMLPLVGELSANTTAALNYLKQHRSRPVSPVYVQYLKRNAKAAHQLSSMISSLVEYERNMEEINRLRSQLEVSGNRDVAPHSGRE
jgi:hypothetical protein